MKNILKKLAALTLASTFTVATIASCSQEETPELLDFLNYTPHFNEEYIVLEKSPDEDFIVLNLTDPQLDSAEWGEGKLTREILEYTIDELIKTTQPDLITVSGDISWGEGNINAYRMFAEFLEQYDIPWAPVWGNHDNEDGTVTVDQIEKLYMEYENCIYLEGEEELGKGNYVISIEENGTPITGIFMMDSHYNDIYIDENGEEYEGYSKLNDEQKLWYEYRAKSMEVLGYKDSAIILHIPIYAYRTAFAEAFNTQYDSASLSWEESFDDKYWNEGYENSFGLNNEGIWSPPIEDGVFDLIESIGNTKAVIAGHDHINNFVINYRGVDLVYALKTGMGCYWEQEINGGTVIRITSNGIEEIYHEFVNVDHIVAAHE